jgi:DNA-binding Xre family transcriptional regulator
MIRRVAAAADLQDERVITSLTKERLTQDEVERIRL